MRTSIALVAIGQVCGLIGIGMWSVPAMLVFLMVELTGLGLLRTPRGVEAAARPVKRTPAAGLHRRRNQVRALLGRARPRLKLIRGAAS